MARTLVAAATVVWSLAGLGGLVLGLVGADTLERALPPLAIDTPALGGAVVAVSTAVLLLAATHGVVVAALRAEHRLARTSAILLCATMCALLAALVAAALTGAASVPERSVPLLGAALAGAVGAAAYGVATGLFVKEIRPSWPT